MSRQVEWSPTAAREFAAHLNYIGKRSVAAVHLVRGRVSEAVANLKSRPMGRVGRIDSTYELYVSKTSLILVYSIHENQAVNLLRVIHTSRDFKPGEYPPET